MAKGLRIANFGVLTVGGINLEILPGQSVGLTGPSGAGKTLLLRALADLDPHQGKMWLDGTAADAVPVDLWRRRVALLPADSAWWHDSVGPHFTDVHEPWLLSLGFGPEVMAWQVSRLSSGERQRLALLRMLMCHPNVLLLDEPSANLDADNTGRVEALLRSYRADRQPVIIWVSHDPELLARCCDQVWEIRGGRLLPADSESRQCRGVP